MFTTPLQRSIDEAESGDLAHEILRKRWSGTLRVSAVSEAERSRGAHDPPPLRAARVSGYLFLGRLTNTAAATTEVHSPSRSPIADWVTLRVVMILSDNFQISLRSS